MGIYIPNMEKSKACAECPFEVIYTSGYPRCVIMQEMVVDGNPFNRCPLIERDDTEWEWCHDCKEYDQEAHCCHRWTKVIRKTVDEVKESYKIVTCGECIYRHEHEWYNTCDKHIGHGFEDDYFCKDGERRGDEHTD